MLHSGVPVMMFSGRPSRLLVALLPATRLGRPQAGIRTDSRAIVHHGRGCRRIRRIGTDERRRRGCASLREAGNQCDARKPSRSAEQRRVSQPFPCGARCLSPRHEKNPSSCSTIRAPMNLPGIAPSVVAQFPWADARDYLAKVAWRHRSTQEPAQVRVERANKIVWQAGVSRNVFLSFDFGLRQIRPLPANWHAPLFLARLSRVLGGAASCSQRRGMRRTDHAVGRQRGRAAPTPPRSGRISPSPFPGPRERA